jgi:hypothetical protein
MAINASLKSLIDYCQGRVFFCHQVPLSILRFLKSGKKEVQPMNPSSGFSLLLAKTRDRAQLYDVKRAVPPNLYEVFGFFRSDDQIWHSSIVVDTSPEVIVAECDNIFNTVSLNPLKKSLASDRPQSVYLYRKEVLDGILLALPLFIRRMLKLDFIK